MLVLLAIGLILLLRHEVRKAHFGEHGPMMSANDWKRFASADGGFSASFPGNPEITTETSSAGTNEVELHLCYVNPNVQNSFAVGYSDSPMFARAAKLSDPQAFLEKSQLVMASNMQARVVYEQPSTFEGFPAREFECVAGGKANYSTRVKYILAGRRIYQIYVVFLTADPYPQERSIFFNSFKILGHTNDVP